MALGEVSSDRESCLPERKQPILTKARYIELFGIAQELCNWLKEKGVKMHETCKLKRMTEELFNLQD